MAAVADTRRSMGSLDWLVLTVAAGALAIAAYEFNLAALGRRLVAETQAWLAEQRHVSRETRYRPPGGQPPPLIDLDELQKVVDEEAQRDAGAGDVPRETSEPAEEVEPE